ALSGERTVERPNADLEARRQAVSRDVLRLHFLDEGGAGTVRERRRVPTDEPVCRVPIEKRQQRGIVPTARQVEKRRRQDERILPGREPQWRTEELLVIARVSWRAMCESHFSGTPVRTGGHAAGPHPRRKEQLGGLAGRGHVARQMMRQDRAISRLLEPDV